MGRIARAWGRAGYAVAATAGRLPGLPDRARNVIDFHALRLATSNPQIEGIVSRGLSRANGRYVPVAIDSIVALANAREIGITALVTGRYYREVGIDSVCIDGSGRWRGAGMARHSRNPETGRSALWFDSNVFSARNRAALLAYYRQTAQTQGYPVQHVLGPGYTYLHELGHGVHGKAVEAVERAPDAHIDAHGSLATRIVASVPFNERQAIGSEPARAYHNAREVLKAEPDPAARQVRLNALDRVHFGEARRNLLSLQVTTVKLGLNAAKNLKEEGADGFAAHQTDIHGLNPTAGAVNGWHLAALGRPEGDRPPQLMTLLPRMIDAHDRVSGDTRVRDASVAPPATNPWLSGHPQVPIPGRTPHAAPVSASQAEAGPGPRPAPRAAEAHQAGAGAAPRVAPAPRQAVHAEPVRTDAAPGPQPGYTPQPAAPARPLAPESSLDRLYNSAAMAASGGPVSGAVAGDGPGTVPQATASGTSAQRGRGSGAELDPKSGAGGTF